MEKIREAMTKMGVVPKLHLGNRQVVPGKDKNGNPKMAIVPSGAHIVTFLAEPTIVPGKSFEGKPRQEFKFIVEENGQKYRWQFPLYNKENQPNYLMERVVDIKVGEKRILEMLSRGATKYIDVRKEGEQSAIPEEFTEDDDLTDDEAQEELANALKKEGNGQA